MVSPFGIASLGSGIASFGSSSKRSKFRVPQLPSLSELAGQATGAQAAQLQGAISNANQFGAEFLTSQIGAQRQALPGFFQQTEAAIGQGEDLISQLTTSDLTRRSTTQAIRSAQAARGNTLSPAAAVQEGLAVQQAELQNQLQALQLRQNLASLEAATPFGVEAFQPGVSSLDQLTGLGLQRAANQAGLQAQGQAVKVQQADASRAAQAAGLGRLSQGFGNISNGGGFQGFLQGAGLAPTQQPIGQSNVATTQAGGSPNFFNSLGSAFGFQ